MAAVAFRRALFALACVCATDASAMRATPAASRAVLAGLSHVMLTPVQARANATSALSVFLISDCAVCTEDGDSIFCTEASSNDNFVSNGTEQYTIAMKKKDLGPSDGARFCWEGTFGRLLRNSGNVSDILGSASVLVELQCSQQNLFYRQCVIPAEMAIILITVAAIVFVGATTCTFFWCGCCKCCNNKGDESRWGMCNRFCPWMPCSDPPKPEDTQAAWQTNPVSDEEQNKSLFGRSTALKAVELKPRSLAELKKPDSKSAV